MKLLLVLLALAPLVLSAQSTGTTAPCKGEADGSFGTAAPHFLEQIPPRLLQKLLKEFDKNQDGKLNPGEEEDAARQSVKKGRAARHQDMLKKFDKNSDGTLDEAEKAEMRKDWHDRLANEREKIRAKFDTDGDGTLNESEKQAAHAAMHQQWESRRKEFLKRFDTDGDGKLSDSEKAAANEAKKNSTKASGEAESKKN